MDSEDELPVKWSGYPQPIFFPVLKEEIGVEENKRVNDEPPSNDEVNNLNPLQPIIILDDSDEEESERNGERTPVSDTVQQQCDTIDLTLDEEENDGDNCNGEDDDDDDDTVDDDSVDDDDGDVGDGDNTGSCGNKEPSSKHLQSNLAIEAAECDKNYVIRPSFICRLCEKCFISQCSLYLPHLVEEMNYLCTICMTLHKNEDTFYEHLKSHKNRYVTCSLCTDKLKPAGIVCTVCSSSFDCEKDYKDHQKTHKNQKVDENNKLSCQVCKRKFVSKTLLQIHERLHTEELFKCNSCGAQFWTQQILIEHQYVCGAPKTSSIFKCSLCQESFCSHAMMAEHMRHCTDSQSRFYYCETCPELFSCANGLVVHRLVHLSGKSTNFLDCDCCNMKFFSATGLAAHKYCTGKVVYSCSPCNLQFFVESSFMSHLRSLHAVKTAALTNSSKKAKEAGNIVVEEIGSCDEIMPRKDDVPQRVVTVQGEPDHDAVRQSPSLSSSRELPDTSLQQDAPSAGRSSTLVSDKNNGEVERYSCEIGPGEEISEISSQSTTGKEIKTAEKVFLNLSNISGNNTPPVDSGLVDLTENNKGNFSTASQIQTNDYHPLSVNVTGSHTKMLPTIKVTDKQSLKPLIRTVSAHSQKLHLEKIAHFRTVTIKPSGYLEVCTPSSQMCDKNDNDKLPGSIEEKMETDDGKVGNVDGVSQKVISQTPSLSGISLNTLRPNIQVKQSVQRQSSLGSSLQNYPNSDTGSQQNSSSFSDKSLLVPKRICDMVIHSDGMSPAKKICNISFEVTTCEQLNTVQKSVLKLPNIAQNNMTQNNCDVIDLTENDESDNISTSSLMNPSFQVQTSAYKPQPVFNTDSTSKSTSNVVYSKNSPKTTATNTVSSSTLFASTTRSEENLHLEIVPGNTIVTVTPSKLMPMLNTTNVQLKPSTSNNCFSIALQNSPSKIQPSSPVYHIITYENAQSARATYIISPAKAQPTSPIIQTLPIVSPVILRSKHFPSIRPKSFASLSDSAPNNQPKPGNLTTFPATLQDSAKFQPNSLVVQTVNDANPQFTQNTNVSITLPRNSISNLCPGEKILMPGNVTGYASCCVPGINLQVQASPQKPEVCVSVSDKTLLSHSPSKINLLSPESTKLQCLPVQALPLNNVKYIPVSKTLSASDVSSSTPIKHPVSGITLPPKRNAHLMSAADSPSKKNASCQVFLEVCKEPGKSRLQPSSHENIIKVEELNGNPDIVLDELKNKHDPKNIIQDRGRELIFHTLKTKMLQRVVFHEVCKFCGTGFTDRFAYRIHNLSCKSGKL